MAETTPRKLYHPFVHALMYACHLKLWQDYQREREESKKKANG